VQRNGAYSRVFYVTDYNANPTGQYDSTKAIHNTINQAFAVATKHELLPGVPDLGGVEIHLEGGDYLISYPLQFPSKGLSPPLLSLQFSVSRVTLDISFEICVSSHQKSLKFSLCGFRVLGWYVYTWMITT
jgi:hypothetical protein